MYCSHCGADNPYDDDKKNCWSCGSKLSKSSSQKGSPPAEPSVSAALRPQARRFSNAQPIWRLIVLSVLTFGLYDLYWFYRNWNHLQALGRSSVSPGRRTLALLIPIYGEVLIYRQIRDIRDAALAAGCPSFSSPAAILAAYLVATALSKLPDPYWLLSLLSVVPLAVVQSTLNGFWAKQQPGLDTRTGFTKGELVVLLIGGVAFLLSIVGMLLPE